MTLRSNLALPLTLLLAVSTSTLLKADLTMPAIFGDNMVLQQKQANPVWGWDEPGTEVTVAFEGQTKTAKAGADGRWEVKLDALPANAKPATMSVIGSKSKVFKNILIGEVWICSGQSNMQWSLSQSDDADIEALMAKYPNIRLISVPQVGTQEPQKDFVGKWEECNPTTAPQFSGVGYFFGRVLHETLDVPVGLIDNAWGGSAAEAWVRRDALAADTRFKSLMDSTAVREADLTKPEAKTKWEAAMAAWKKRAEEAKIAGKPFAERAPQGPDGYLKGNSRPGNIFSGVLLPTIGYGIKGAIWYQGESNASRAHEYRALFPFMISHWRELWKQGDFPFYWVQLADFREEKPMAGDSDWAELREAQTLTMDAIKNGGQAVIIDLGEAKDIHPKNKRDVAERLARWALNKDYGVQLLAHRSPQFKSAAFKDGKATVSIDTFGGALTTFDVAQGKGFALCGEDKKWVWADTATVGTNTIEVSSKAVAKPIAVRYAWSDNPVCNVYSRDGLPLTPFRSDDFPMITAPKAP
jgi:sialate O-acetylesterase